MIQCKGKSKTFSEFCSHMKDREFEVKPSYNSQGAMFGMRIEGQGESFKLSEINRKIKHYHFADILPKDALIQITDLKTKSVKGSGNFIKDSITNQIKAVDIANSLSLDKLAINVTDDVIRNTVRGMRR